jgi:mono/diheme cytochrome c family protein
VFGVVSGVAIWWTISLINPNATHSLIQVYTLGWAEEYLFFVAELATIFVYYYTWNRLSRERHLLLARLYAGFSVMTLVIINGIITYMLTPGGWLQTKNWLDGFFNETYWPSLLVRLTAMVAIAGMYALVTAAAIKNNDAFRTRMLRYSAKWFLPMFLIGPLLAYWYYHNLPADVVQNLWTGIQTSGTGNFSILGRVTYLSLILSGTILVFAFVGPYLNPQGFSFRMALCYLACGVMVTGMAEYTREMLRQPFAIYNYMYSNGVRKDAVAALNRDGFLKSVRWAAVMAEPKPGTIAATESKKWMAHLSSSAMGGQTPQLAEKWRQGRSMFQNQCMACHTTDGYRSMKALLGERNPEAIRSLLGLLHETDPEKNPYSHIMPPLAGTPQELDALALYLSTLNRPQAEEGAPPPTQTTAQATAGPQGE